MRMDNVYSLDEMHPTLDSAVSVARPVILTRAQFVRVMDICNFSTRVRRRWRCVLHWGALRYVPRSRVSHTARHNRRTTPHASVTAPLVQQLRRRARRRI